MMVERLRGEAAENAGGWAGEDAAPSITPTIT